MVKIYKFKKEIKEALKISLPVGIGYISIAIAFGLLAKNSNLTLLDTFLFSAVLYAGASQFMAIELIMAGVPVIGIAISVFLLNLRLLVMATSLGVKTDKIDKKAIPILGLLLTDESFSMLSFTKKKLTTVYSLFVEIIPYLFWVGFSVVGYIIGDILPEKLTISLGIGLPAMFVALLVPSLKKNTRGIVLSIMAGTIYGIIYITKIIPTGWDIVVGILLSSFIGYVLIRKGVI
ncbi:AzlC family ABC transporter permease [Miniphocaeibacter massiliensis]|uniref:AzlC family ABC transporter permease n=1 Tax=Miniphocaeibacter massiliensis TaxID=2041841 RepID=UPI001F5C1601|nr:AzlC family ABC transporter permease [Miniphocaeibacter massiliensis]